jgi:hypothetical protein
MPEGQHGGGIPVLEKKLRDARFTARWVRRGGRPGLFRLIATTSRSK